MARRRWIAAASLGICVLAAVVVVALGSGVSGTDVLIATSKAPARHCATYDAPALRALRSGEKRLVVVVKAFQPADPPATGLVVWMLGADKTKRQEVARFAVHPLRAFTAKEGRRQQRFLVPLAEYASLIDDGQPLCFEVGFDTSSGKVAGGSAEVDIELARVPTLSGK